MESDNPQVFLSYAHNDLETVRRLYDALVEREVNVWFDKEDLGPGRWKKKIEKAIPQSRYFIFCVSSASLAKIKHGSGYVDDELQHAYGIANAQDERSFTIIPVRLEDVGHGDHRLSVFQQYDLFEDWEDVVDRLAVYMGGKALGTVVGREELSEDEWLIESLMGKAMMAYYADEQDKSQQILETVISLKPDYEYALILRGLGLVKRSLFHEAVEILDRLLKVNTDHIHAQYYKAFSLMALEHYDDALISLDKFLKLSPSDADAWFNRGLILLQLENYEDALQAFRKVVELMPFEADSWIHHGTSLALLFRFEEAIESFEKAIILDSENKNAWASLGLAYQSMGKYENALEAYSEALRLNPEDGDVWYKKGIILSILGQNEEGAKAIEKAKYLGYKES